MRAALALNHLALLICGVLSLLSTAPEDAPAMAKLLFAGAAYGPLLLFLPASLLADKRLLTWFSFLLMFYFSWFVTQAVDPPPLRYWAVVNITLSITLFCLLVVVMRKPAAGPSRD